MIWSFLETAFVAFMILIIAGLAALVGLISGALVIALCIFVGLSFLYWLIAIVLAPRPSLPDPHSNPFGDVPKVPHGR